MISILKYENIFGIKKLIGADKLGKINVIYAPNGTAKSSIADSLELISNRQIESIKDVYGSNNSPIFKLRLDDGKECTNDEFNKSSVIKYNATNEFLLKNQDCSKIVISKQTSQIVASSLKEIELSGITIKRLIENHFSGKKITQSMKKSLALIAGKDFDDKDFALSLIKKVDLNSIILPMPINEKVFTTFEKGKAQEICEKSDVKNSTKAYFEEIKRISSSQGRHAIFDENFTLLKLEDFHQKAQSSGFYKDEPPERKLYIDGKILGKNDIEVIITNERDRIFETPEAQKKFDEVKKSLEKQSTLTTILKDNPSLIPELMDYSQLTNKLFVTLFKDILGPLKNEKSKIEAEQQKIEEIRLKNQSNDEVIKTIWAKFQSRFKFKKFDLKIENEFSAKIGAEFPTFVKYIPGTAKRIDDPKLLRFSTGEIRTYNLINFILTVEETRLRNEKVTIILDDAVDSFDYKNKYGIIDYLCEVANDENMQLIVLTHNFDFYRSSILAFGKNKCNQYFAYKNDEGIVEFLDTKTSNYYLELSNFNGWKTSPTIYQLFALVPFTRNLIQLRTSSGDPLTKEIDSYLHYTKSIESKTFNDLLDCMNNALVIKKLPKNTHGDELFLAKLSDSVKNLLDNSNKIKETDLEFKITLGLYIRLSLEKYLSQKITNNNGQLPSEDSESKYARTRNLLSIADSYLDEKEKEKAINANLLSPSYIHANSFMYEPLIDVGLQDLIESARWLYQALN